MTSAGTSSNGALSFPAHFTWGAATAAYQIEGAANVDGRGLSIWDTFSRQPGKINRGDTGDVACDAYHRYREDVALMSTLGLNSYRFSISWPRVQPGGTGAINQQGLDYYKALLDELANHNIAAAVTLYHWDLPQELQDVGGWAVRSTAERFSEFAQIIAEQLGDRVASWITLNEPQVVASHGYRDGNHAPGLQDDEAAAAATHHLLVAHGLAAQALRSVTPNTPVGITLDLHPVLLTGDHSDVLEQARVATDAEQNGIFLDPVLHGRYPAGARAVLLPSDSLIADRDFATIQQPLDFLGINYYAPVYLRAGDPDDLRQHEEPASCGLPGVVEYRPSELERTPMGWLVNSDGLYQLLVRLSEEAPGLPLYVTENGRASEDYVDPKGVVNDVDRINYLHQHLDASARAIKAGVNLAGYYVWSLLDNFEWGWGYQKRFGIVYVDFETQRRIPKASAGFYGNVVRANAVPSLPAG